MFDLLDSGWLNQTRSDAAGVLLASLECEYCARVREDLGAAHGRARGESSSGRQLQWRSARRAAWLGDAPAPQRAAWLGGAPPPQRAVWQGGAPPWWAAWQGGAPQRHAA